MKPKFYIDQNILGFLFDGSLDLSSISEVEWIFSDEHFNEIKRGNKIELLDVLEKINANKLTLKLDEQFKITGEAYISPNCSILKSYNDYLEAINDIPENNGLQLLQTYFNGNVNAFDPEEFIAKQENYLKELIEPHFSMLETDESEMLLGKIHSIMTDFKNTLEDTRGHIKPLDKARKLLTKDQLSDLDDNCNEIIIDQIWRKIENNMDSLSKDQFFGKISVNDSNISPVYLQLISCYYILNYIGYWPDHKMSNIRNIYGINSDASHVANAAYCDCYLTGDVRQCKKAKAIYQYFGIKTIIFLFDEKNPLNLITKL